MSERAGERVSVVCPFEAKMRMKTFSPPVNMLTGSGQQSAQSHALGRFQEVILECAALFRPLAARRRALWCGQALLRAFAAPRVSGSFRHRPQRLISFPLCSSVDLFFLFSLSSFFSLSSRPMCFQRNPTERSSNPKHMRCARSSGMP